MSSGVLFLSEEAWAIIQEGTPTWEIAMQNGHACQKGSHIWCSLGHLAGVARGHLSELTRCHLMVVGRYHLAVVARAT